MKYRNFKPLLVVVLSMVFNCCRSDYSKLVIKEINSGIKNDSIFFGIYFGNTKSEYYKKCWEMNKQKVLFHGSKNMNVKYLLKKIDENSPQIQMLFSPEYNEDDKIHKMNVEFSYTGWASWNKHLYSDRLIPIVQDSILQWYQGNEFLKIELEEFPNEEIWVKVDGNRRISLKKDGSKVVLVRISNLIK